MLRLFIDRGNDWLTANREFKEALPGVANAPHQTRRQMSSKYSWLTVEQAELYEAAQRLHARDFIEIIRNEDTMLFIKPNHFRILSANPSWVGSSAPVREISGEQKRKSRGSA